MDLGIAGKRAVVTGASAGLGLACCEALAAEGVDLMLFARGQDALAEARDKLVDNYGVTVSTHAGDVTDRGDVLALADSLRTSGGVDILVLNTPRPPSPMREFLDETEDERWEDAYRNQLHGALIVLRTITPLIVDRGWGRVIAVTSASVKQPMARHAVSTVFRAGVQAALKHLANEIGEHGVTVNSVAPAGIVTPTFGQFHDVKERAAAMPVRRLGTAEELGAVVAFLASQRAGFLTGQVIQLDGGLTASLV
jgi:3-oxoacyl-[acyl-carrier protein] reductase